MTCFVGWKKRHKTRTIILPIIAAIVVSLWSVVAGLSRDAEMRVQFEVKEGEPAGVLIGTIPVKVNFTYRFNENPDEFHLDGVTGEVTTTTELDRESLVNDKFDLVILSSQPTYPIEMRIIVLDINDNSPAFLEPSIDVSFAENSNIGTRFILDTATDRDIGVNDVTTDYRIVSGNEDKKFRLLVTTNPSGETPYLHLETTGRLDREIRSSYTLNVSARDGGTPPRYGYLQVNINILDVNDNPPIFDHSDYSVSVNESTPPGTSILQVRATDSDADDNAQISYFLADKETQFAIDSENGIITTVDYLKCKQNCPSEDRCSRSCVFAVLARDHGLPSQDGRAYVSVSLVDANDHDPVITLRYFPPASDYASVDENAQNGSLVAAISVIDLDEGPNGETSIFISDGNNLSHYRLEPTPSFVILRVNGVLDREKISRYNLTIKAVDRGVPPRTATSYLVIQVNDINDHKPVFETEVYVAEIDENSPVGSYVIGVRASDYSSKLYYSIVSGDDHNWFSITPNTGLVTTAKMLDRKLKDIVTLKLAARDSGSNPRWTYSQLQIHLLDNNDHIPMFPASFVDVEIKETHPPYSSIVVVSASDEDLGANGTVSYYLDSTVELMYPHTFVLDRERGDLSSIATFDRERLYAYEVAIIAKDSGRPPLSSSVTIRLHILDVNDNSPRFQQRFYVNSVNVTAPIGTELGRVHATDRDSESNIFYSLIGGDTDSFEVNKHTGVIRTTKQLQRLRKTRYQLEISASEADNSSDPDSTIIYIYLQHDKGNLRMEFAQKEGYHFQIEEEREKAEPIVKEVGTVNLVGKTEKVEYYITSGNTLDWFKIQKATGVLQSTSVIDREIADKVTITVVACLDEWYTTTTVNITISDVNDNHPVFISLKNRIQVREDYPAGSTVYVAKAIDLDSNENGRVQYSLASDRNNTFSVNQTSGEIIVNTSLINKAGSIFEIAVIARDSGKSSLGASHQITVEIEDVNNHVPRFENPSYEISLPESTAVNSKILRFVARDGDFGNNGFVVYSTERNKKFGVFPDGHLYLKEELDREILDYYEFVAIATDNGNPPRRSTANVVVHVSDENDNPPKFQNSTWIWRIPENVLPNTFVGRLVASDSDFCKNGNVVYSISANQNDLAVEPNTGHLRTTRLIDRESLVESTGHNFISLEAIAKDGGGLKDVAKVIVYVTDVNDNDPVFTRAPYNVQLSENALTGTQIIKINALDRDEGANSELSYALADNTSLHTFQIDQKNGQITLVGNLDRETEEVHVLKVVAYDAGEPKRSSTGTVTVTVLDENDNPPVFFTGNTWKLEIDEDATAGSIIGKFSATDVDLGNEITYSLSSLDYKNVFRIDSAGGVLRLLLNLDREERDRYNLIVTASDNGTPRLSSMHPVTIIIRDLNDNPPVFSSDSVFRVTENMPSGTRVGRAFATDPDDHVNGKLKYNISRQLPWGDHFSIDENTGVIRTRRQLDRELIDTYELTLTCNDMAVSEANRLTAEKIVSVLVDDVNDCAPTFVSVDVGVLHEGSSRDDVIMMLSASDPDAEMNGTVTYDFEETGTDMFGLDSTTGALFLKRDIGKPFPLYNLTIVATDNGYGVWKKSSRSKIMILGVTNREEGPVFSASEFSGSVYENQPVGKSVLTVRAQWNEQTPINYYLTGIYSKGLPHRRIFDVNRRTGVISTVQMLDSEGEAQVFELEVYAVATTGTHSRSSKTKVSITMLDENDSPPFFTQDAYHANVSEDAPRGHVIIQVVATDHDTEGTITYLITENGPFQIDSETGIVTLSEPLDRESCAQHKMKLVATDGVQNGSSILIVLVNDVNDNRPEFEADLYSFDVPENAPPGTEIGGVVAVDRDGDTQINYSVLSGWGTDVFTLNPLTGVFSSTSTLDYEEEQLYMVAVQAEDSGRPSLSATVSVYINVVDVNDNVPTFQMSTYRQEVFENVTTGTSIIQVTANDLDSGENGEVEYAITEGDLETDFTITTNGTVVTNKKLDREKVSFYNLVVAAYNKPPPQQATLSSKVLVTIVLKDVNDNAPQFVNPTVVSVNENIQKNSILMSVKAIDQDDGTNSYVDYSLVNHKDIFSLGTVDGHLKLLTALDREVTSSYNVTILAQDRGQPVLSSSVTITIHVNDVNDNNPKFEKSQYVANVSEDSPIGMSVLRVTATDPDENVKGPVLFTIVSGNVNLHYMVDPYSGVIRINRQLDREKIDRYILELQVEDRGEITRYDRATVTIIITDVNDNAPIFPDNPYVARVMENFVHLPVHVISLKATDADQGGTVIHYEIQDGDKEAFQIEKTRGILTMKTRADREELDRHILIVVAIDSGNPPLTGTATVIVIVDDVNDNPPVFARQHYVGSIDENLPPESEILKIVASDKDYGSNAQIRYALASEYQGIFSINEETGIIATRHSLNREEVDVYNMIVTASDCGLGIRHTATAQLTIEVIDKNDNPPSFPSENYTVFLPNNAVEGHFVHGVQAEDYDIGENGKLLYQVNDSTTFAINQSTGVLQLNRPISAEDDSLFVTVHAKDSGQPYLSSSYQLQLKVLPANQFPHFLSDHNQFRLLESLTNHHITTLAAVSSHPSHESRLRYAIGGGNNHQVFDVSHRTGEVRLVGKLDREKISTYELWIQAFDGDLASSVMLEIKVDDVNDNSPLFTKVKYQAFIGEDLDPPQKVLIVTADDGDEGSNGSLRYELEDSFDSTFSVDSHTGIIYTNMKLDREEKDSYALTVVAKDGGNPQRSSIAIVTIIVMDKNDNPPRFTRLFTSNVTENAPLGTFVVHLTSSDKDVGSNANATYSFVENWGDVFHVDSKSGNVTVSGLLDREVREEYVLKVAAVDGSWRAETHLTVSVQDVNDNPPIFSQSVYHFTVPRTLLASVNIGRVTASDRDKQGPNSTLTYSFRHPDMKFTIDPDTGDIYTRTELSWILFTDQYTLRVVATDHGRPPLSSQADVIIEVVETNSGPPTFDQMNSLYPVPANARIGLPVLQISAHDAIDNGVKSEIEYLVTGGNGSLHFCIREKDDWITVCESFESSVGTIFLLEIEARDSGFPQMATNTSIRLLVTEDNANAPEFPSPTYQVVITENEVVGSKLIAMTAVDIDKGINGEIFYDIKAGNIEGKFYIHRETGMVSIANYLDYEATKEYQLKIQARDRGFQQRQSEAMLTILLTDVNDNPPTFNSSLVSLTIPEDIPRGSDVTSIVATDKDTGRHSAIHYEFIEKEISRYFDIDRMTGTLRTANNFDYEKQLIYRFTVKAKNPESDLYATVKVKVTISGVNEYSPRFLQSVFRFAVIESSPPGTSVGKVIATDEDNGLDGRIYYLMLDGVRRDERLFGLDKETGVVYVSRKLDRESRSNVTFRVIAKNSGSVRGNNTDFCEVRIFIQDVNDPPIFSKRSYDSRIPEDAPINTEVIRLSASDLDEYPEHNQLSYSIASGNVNESFRIDEITGVITVASPLDREVIGVYHLMVTATDKGSPSQTGTTSVHIFVDDVNDNAPSFDSKDLTGRVYEDEPIGTRIMVLQAKDADLPPNSSPFTYRLTEAKATEFIRIDSKSGAVVTADVFDRGAMPSVSFLVEVEDNGTPSMKSTHTLKIIVLDRNNHAPVSRNLRVTVWWLPVPFDEAVIANVKPFDSHISGNYKCRLGSYTNGFRIGPGCDLVASEVQNVSLIATGSDGIHTEFTTNVDVQFVVIENGTLENSVTVLWRNITSDEYLINHSEKFLKHLDDLFVSLGHPAIFSVTRSGENVQIHLAIKTSENTFQTPNTVIGVLSGKLPPGIDAGYDPCTLRPCQNGGRCRSYLKIERKLTLSSSPNIALATPTAYRNFTCDCVSIYTGASCEETADPCTSNPCLNGGRCKGYERHYNCSCPHRYKGPRCEEASVQRCSSSPCQNGGTCEEVALENYFCLCRSGYRGIHCEFTSDICRPNRCLNGGTCVINKLGYSCQCSVRFYGRHCEKSTWGFHPYSYMEFPPVSYTSSIELTITFLNSQQHALLVYSGTVTSDDFIALQIENSKLKFNYGTIGGQGIVASDKVMDAGKWYKASIISVGKEIWLSIVDCTQQGSTCDDCAPGNTTCSLFSPMFSGVPNLSSGQLYLGGVSALSIISRHGVEQDDFIGCLREFTIGGKTMDLESPLASKYTKSDCGRIATCDDTPSCSEGIPCRANFFNRICECSNGLTSPDCEKAIQPFSMQDGQAYLEVIPREKYQRHVIRRGSPRRLSFEFRTFSTEGELLAASTSNGQSYLRVEKGNLHYVSSKNDDVKRQEISNIQLVDGEWHRVVVEYDTDTHKSSLNVSLDGKWRVLESIHNFLMVEQLQVVIGGKDGTFIGCIKMIALNNEIQAEKSGEDSSQYFEIRPVGKVVKGSCLPSLYERSLIATDPLSIGVILVIVFFAVLIVSILASFLIYRSRKQFKQSKTSGQTKETNPSRTSDLTISRPEPENNETLTTGRIPQDLVPKKLEPPQRPDIIGRDVLGKLPEERARPEREQSPELSSCNKIIQDVDTQASGYHYKGSRDGAPRFTNSFQLPQRTRRLSLSGELSSRIQAFKEGQQMSRVTSCCPTTSDATPRPETETQQKVPFARNISLATTLDAISSSSEDAPAKDKLGYLCSPYQQDSTTDESGNDSFTCSEFEYDKNEAGANANQNIAPKSSDSQCYKLPDGSELKWENLLNWSPNYENLVGVCKDIGYLQHASANAGTVASVEDFV